MALNISDLIKQSQASSKSAQFKDKKNTEKEETEEVSEFELEDQKKDQKNIAQQEKDLLADVSEEAKKVSGKLDEKIVDIELKQAEAKAQDKATKVGVQYISLKGFPISPEILSLIPEKEAKETETVCFFRLEAEIRLATTGKDMPATNKIVERLNKKNPGSHIVVYITSKHSFDLAFTLYKNIAKIKHIETDIKITQKDLEYFQKDLENYGDFEKKITQVNLTQAFAMMIAMALKVGSSDIHIEAGETQVTIRFRVDGMLQVAANIPASIWPRLISRIKTISGLKINITQVPQDGRITIKMDKDKMDIRVSTMPTAFGESVVMRLLKSSSIDLSFEDLGLREVAFKKLDAAISQPDGMIVTTGPTGSGKTTTLYAILNKLNQPDTKIITLENPIEYKLANIAQSQIDHSKGYTFPKGLRAILRQDPDVVMVGEIRDLETAETAIQAALTGHLMLSTIHTNDAAGAIPRFLSMGVAPFLLAPALKAIIGQRLVRKVCEQCKQETTLSHEEADKVKKVLASIPENSGEKIPKFEEVKFYKGNGCEKCNKTGYKGRLGIYEVFSMTKEIEAITLSGQVSEYQMKEMNHKTGMVTMAQDGILKACDGITHPEEVFRVAHWDEPTASADSAPDPSES